MSSPFQKYIVKPVQLFLNMEAKSGVLLGFFTLLAMIMANSEAAAPYFAFWQAKVLGLSLQHWVNDALMVVFFFVIGMEIKKELVVGELNSIKKATLPVAAAIGGMALPALIYFYFNPSGAGSSGWGIPMATDIAFALGVLSLFGKRIPLALKVFLLAIAIVDDLGAILVIALFYTAQIKWSGLLIAGSFLGLMYLAQRSGKRSYLLYSLLGVVVWWGFLLSGVHATISGVLIGFLTPLKFPILDGSGKEQSPLDDIVHFLHPWVSYWIMPLFAFANAGVAFTGVEIDKLLNSSVLTGVTLGLLVGKPVGVFLFSFLVVKLKLASLGSGLSWKDILAVGMLAGIGFTMSLFISALALPQEFEIYSKTGIVLGSLLSGVIGSAFIALTRRETTREVTTAS